MIKENKNYLVSEINSSGILYLRIVNGDSVIAKLKNSEYQKGTKIIELGQEYEVLISSDLKLISPK